ncbi:MAG: hemolysin III family protein [Xanthomonadaceae bacterium]|nr:hemolysin III family protein [Xanthomonadaceae bacterium]
MFFIMIGACVPLIMRCHNLAERVSIIIYTLCTLTMFGVSTLYHRKNWNKKHRLFWKKLDHSAIFLMIAGTFTPIAFLSLSPSSSTKLLIMSWGVALAGIVQSIFFVNLPKLVHSIIYLTAGYLVLPYFSEIKLSVGQSNIWLIIAGGIAFSLGAICYGIKRPILNPQVFGYHEVFHLLVNCGAILHFIVINSLIK